MVVEFSVTGWCLAGLGGLRSIVISAGRVGGCLFPSIFVISDASRVVGGGCVALSVLLIWIILVAVVHTGGIVVEGNCECEEFKAMA